MLSTPFICCSMGVATACSRVCASAPTYVANTWISGGVMLGNCATGKLRTVREPTSTMTMEITMATMGRLMKNFDMDQSVLNDSSILSSSILGSRILGSRCKRFGIHVHPGAHSLNPFRHHSLAGVQAARDDPPAIHPVPHGDGSNVDFVV